MFSVVNRRWRTLSAALALAVGALGACAPAPKPAPTKVSAMTYVGDSPYKGYDDQFVVNATFCMDVVPDVDGGPERYTIKKGVRVHARGEGDISMATLFTGTKNGAKWSYKLPGWIYSDQTYRKVPAAGSVCGGSAPIIG